MAITLKRPVPSCLPVVVEGVSVVRIDLLSVPTSLREHAWTVAEESHGPLTQVWRSMGTFYPGGSVARVLVARVAREGGEWRMQYGYVLAHVPARQLLECTGCGDVRPDADVESEGVSLGARCVHLGCPGVYADMR